MNEGRYLILLDFQDLVIQRVPLNYVFWASKWLAKEVTQVVRWDLLGMLGQCPEALC